jgi:5-methylcytosine-specific restriction endonuclease McrA
MTRPLCIKCKKRLARKNYKTGGFKRNCDICDRSPEKMIKRRVIANKKSSSGRVWKKYRKDYCESPMCQWIGPFASCMLHVDHIDGDKKNNDPSNYQTLCANCHTLKTMTNGENKPMHLRRPLTSPTAPAIIDT